MTLKTVGILAGTLVWSTSTGARADQAVGTERETLLVRTYDQFGISEDALKEARRYVEVIFGKAGVGLSWTDCRRTAPAAARCDEPLTANEVILRIQASAVEQTTRTMSMGHSLVTPNQPAAAPSVSTVYADIVRSVARSAGVDNQRVLGYAIAHELGHLLLNDPRHSEDGLMRALWSHLSLQRNKPSDFMFLSTEAGIIRKAVIGRENIRDSGDDSGVEPGHRSSGGSADPGPVQQSECAPATR